MRGLLENQNNCPKLIYKKKGSSVTKIDYIINLMKVTMIVLAT
jgi:hypothetical protein